MSRWIVFLLCTFLALPLAAADEAERGEPQYEETRQLVGLVASAGELIAEAGVEAGCTEFREEGSRWLRDETYVFVIGIDGTTVCHAVRPSLEGKSLLELRDPHGRPIVRNFLREVEGDSRDGWEHYLWPRPGQQTFYWKTSYVRRVTAPDGADYVVGSGLYQMKTEPFFIVEQVSDAVRLIAKDGRAAFATLRDRASGFRFLDAYIFVIDDKGQTLVNAGFPELEGTNTLDLRDVDGKMIGREMLELVAQQEAGWVDYMWPRPGDRRPAKKSSYVRRVEHGGESFVVGAGVYIN